MPKVKKSTPPNQAGIDVVCGVIDEIADNFYALTPEKIELKLSTAVSKLYKKKIIRPGPHFDFSLRSALSLLLKGGDQDILDDAEQISSLIDSYIDEPSEDDLEKALDLMLAVRERLKASPQP